MFKLVGSTDGAAQIVYSNYMMKDSEAGTYGEMMTLSAGRLTKCAANGTPQFLLKSKVTAGTDVKVECVPVRRDYIYEVDISGTASLVTAVIGAKTVCLDSTGLLLDATALTGGKLEVLSVDETKKKARVRVDV